jgi:alkylated DNA repair dioxygenase AlkB
MLALKTSREKNWRNLQFLSANLYHTGTEGMGWHSDAEKNLKKMELSPLSFGAERKFTFKHRDSKETVSQNLSHGSLLVMKDEPNSLAAPLTPLHALLLLE